MSPRNCADEVIEYPLLALSLTHKRHKWLNIRVVHWIIRW
jgi:hypothetical protein